MSSGAGPRDGQQPLARVRSYARRGGRLTPPQQAAWSRCADQWLIPSTVTDHGWLDQPRWFGREAPLIVEIGSGVGDAVAALAAARPSNDVLAFEVWRPGVASTFRHLERAEVDNVRVLMVDAEVGLDQLLMAGSVSELWTFFPDPWPKTKHHKRRLITPRFAALAASRLAQGAGWRLATDWPDYAEQMREVLDAEPLLDGGVTERWTERPLTKFERRGLREGRPVADLCYTRVHE